MPFNKKYYSTSPDLEQRDWVLFSMQNLIENVDPLISVQIITLGTTKLLVASQISENSITKLSFLTNNDANNNYLYLEHFSVYLNLYNEPLSIPGLSEIVINQYRRSDIINGFIPGKKTFQPFCSCNLGNTNFNDMVDNITSVIPGCTSTKNKQKFYEIVLNPDLPSISNDYQDEYKEKYKDQYQEATGANQKNKEDFEKANAAFNKFNEAVAAGSALYNKAKTEAQGVPGAFINTFSNPTQKIFFLRQPINAFKNTIKSAKNYNPPKLPSIPPVIESTVTKSVNSLLPIVSNNFNQTVTQPVQQAVNSLKFW